MCYFDLHTFIYNWVSGISEFVEKNIFNNVTIEKNNEKSQNLSYKYHI